MAKKSIKEKEKIKIKNQYIKDFQTSYNTLNNKEEYLKAVFIKILKDNQDDSLIKLIDLKNAYRDQLSQKLKNDPKLTQIFKNLIGSNKDNKTSFIRDPHVDWYYCEKVSENDPRIDEKYRKPIQLPKKLERSRTKKFYVFYSSIVDDSLATTVMEAKKDNESIVDDSYDNIDFDNILTKKLDYVDMQVRSKKIGEIGEEYIFKLEKERLKRLNINKDPKWISQKNDSYGFDILSYRKDVRNQAHRVYIEVKTTTGSLYNQFYVSDLELKTSQKESNKYILTRVYNASDMQKISYKEYSGDIKKNKSLVIVNSNTTTTFKVKED